MKTTELIARGAALPDIGRQRSRRRRGVRAAAGRRDRRDHHADGHRHRRVVEKVDVTDAELEAGKDVSCATSW